MLQQSEGLHKGRQNQRSMPCFVALPLSTNTSVCADGHRTSWRDSYKAQVLLRNPWSRGHATPTNKRATCTVLSNADRRQPITSSLNPGKDWGQLAASDFDDLLTTGQLPLCFVGMSNCGKSHWSEQLKVLKGFDRVCVDDEIENAIRPELESLGYDGISGMAQWMGYPSDERFATNEKRYLALEEEVTAGILPKGNSNFVLDTTGSVVYLSSQTLSQLQSNYLIVHLAATEDLLKAMKTSYFEMPKPVVWGTSYNSLGAESPIESLKRCYDGLLKERYKRYSDLAHIAVPASVALSPDVKVDEFLDAIRSKLKALAKMTWS